VYTYELKSSIINGCVKQEVFEKHFNYKASSQIINLKYNAYDNNFHIVTNDGMDEWFKVGE